MRLATRELPKETKTRTGFEKDESLETPSWWEAVLRRLRVDLLCESSSFTRSFARCRDVAGAGGRWYFVLRDIRGSRHVVGRRALRRTTELHDLATSSDTMEVVELCPTCS